MRMKQLSVQDAYAIIKRKHPGKVIRSCVEFDEFYAFYMVPKELATEDLISSQFVDAVEKETGKLFTYNIFSDKHAYRNARNIDVRLFK